MPPPLNATDVVLGMLADDAPSSLRQALPSSVQQLIIRAMPGFTVPVPPAATPQQCAAWASLFDQECMRRTAGEGWALVPAQNGACEPPDAAASGRASSAVTACSPRVLVQLGASPALDAYASVAARVAAGWVAIVAVPRAADYARLRNASATVMRGDGGRGGGPQAAAAAARLRLHHAGVCAFVALQDVPFSMGATMFVPGTHKNTAERRALIDLKGFSDGSREAALRSVRSRHTMLKAGDAVVFDMRTLHAGTANFAAEDGGKQRLLLAITFRYRKATEPLGHAPNLRPVYRDRGITLAEMRSELLSDAPFAGVASDGQPFGDGLPALASE